MRVAALFASGKPFKSPAADFVQDELRRFINAINI
jgi:hypothetical protein